jgi:hypothetical protein
LRNSLSDTARDFRAATPGILKRRIDRPSRFAVSPAAARFTRADKRNGDRIRASVYIAEAQAAYLQQLEFGGISKGLHMPVASIARDASGNVRRRFQRTASAKARFFSQTVPMPAAKGVRRVGRYFEGLPVGGRYRSAGLFMRTKDGGIKRVSLRRSRLLQGIARRTKIRKSSRRPPLGRRKRWSRRRGSPAHRSGGDLLTLL